MKNPEIFSKSLSKAKRIRAIIQDVFRKDYNKKKKVFKTSTGLDGNEVLKHLVDMYHYRNGGYPSPASPPKHKELLDKFIIFLKYFQFLDLDKEFITDYLAEYGIKVEIEKDSKVDDYKLDTDVKDFVKAEAEFDVTTFKELLQKMLFYCDGLQSEICGHSNQIKRDIAENVKEECEIKKGHFTSTVMFEHRKDKEKEKAELRGKGDNLVKLKTSLESDLKSHSEMAEIKREGILLK